MATATREASTFRLEYGVTTDIAAPPERVWALLTDLEGWTRWNGAITSIEGELAIGRALKLRVPISERTFTPKVAALEPHRRMVWRDGMAPMFTGVRTYSLTPAGAGATSFAMTEVFAGLMLPMIKGSLPDFRPSFERFATDLARAAEERSQ